MAGLRAARRPRAKSFNEAADEFLRWIEDSMTMKQSSIGRIEVSFASARAYFGPRPLADIQARDVEAYRNHRLAVHRCKPVTVRHDLHALSRLWNWAVRQGLAAGNVIASVEKPSAKEARREYVLTTEEERNYFAAAAQVSELLHDAARIMREQGLRPEEALEIRKDCVDWSAGRLQIVQGKTPAARRSLLMSPVTREILAKRMAGVGDWCFPSPRYSGRPASKLNGQHDKALAKCGLSFVLYDLRHTFATRAAEAGMDLATLAAVLGHSSLRVVERYVHPTRGHQDESMRALWERMTVDRGNVPTKNPKSSTEHGAEK